MAANLPAEFQSLASHALSPFERWMVEQTVEIKKILESERVIVIKEKCCCPVPPVPPVNPGSTTPAPKVPVLFPGDSVNMLRSKVTLPDMPVNANGVPDVKLVLASQEAGAEVKLQEFTSGGASTAAGIDINEGTNGEAWCYSVDGKGNPSPESPRATWTNAQDGTSSPAPAAPVVGTPDSTPDAPVLGAMKKK